MTTDNGTTPAPAPRNRKNPRLYQSYQELISLRIERGGHITRIKHVEAGRSNMDAQLEADFMEAKNLDAAIDLVTKKMHLFGETVGPIWGMVNSVKGIGPTLAAQLLALIDDIGNFDTVSKLWRYAGLAVIDGKAEPKSSTHFVRRFKGLMWNISKQFVMQQSPGYVDIYYDEKERQRRLYPEAIQVTVNGEKKWRYNDAHIDRRARRKVEKIFLQHLWLMWRASEGLPLTDPYVHDVLGHTHIVTPEECGWPKEMMRIEP